VGIQDLVDLENHRVQDREHGGHEPQAECHGYNDRRGGKRRTQDRAQGVADVAQQIVEHGRSTETGRRPSP
jgi:hypothetical protein